MAPYISYRTIVRGRRSCSDYSTILAGRMVSTIEYRRPSGLAERTKEVLGGAGQRQRDLATKRRTLLRGISHIALTHGLKSCFGWGGSSNDPARSGGVQKPLSTSVSVPQKEHVRANPTFSWRPKQLSAGSWHHRASCTYRKIGFPDNRGWEIIAQ